MNILKRKRKPSVVHLTDSQQQDPNERYMLAQEIGELSRSIEKITFRLQQSERRQMALLKSNNSLRSELTRLKKVVMVVPPTGKSLSSARVNTSPATRTPAPNSESSSPDFTSAIDELTTRNH